MLVISVKGFSLTILPEINNSIPGELLRLDICMVGDYGLPMSEGINYTWTWK